MNRIVLIGNGFDKAHNLPTSYAEFFEYYWQQKVIEMKRNRLDNDALCSFRKPIATNWATIVDEYDKADSLNTFFKNIVQYSSAYVISLSPFLNAIKAEYEDKGWVDIENEYYRFLTAILDGKYRTEYPTVEVLNEQLNSLKIKLISYLRDISDNQIKDSIINPSILQKIYKPFRVGEIAVSGGYKFREFLRHRWNEELKELERYKNSYLDISKYITTTNSQDIQEYFDLILSSSKKKHRKAEDEHIYSIFHRKRDFAYNNVQDFLLLPERILILTFNYTKTAELYMINQHPGIDVNHIHGELTNPDSIIFGYGDDTDDDYVRIEKLNDNAYMNNIKAFNYLGSVNYRHMLEFIESAPYQIYIMGHSCGTSDRTLLNTLFEHDNCISIKPYFYQKSLTEDNYLELVQNISRNFKSRPKMRDRVVNKTFCEPLIKLEPEI